MRVVKKGTKNTKSIAYKSLVRPILEYGAACWDPYRECQINTLDRVQNRAVKFAHQTSGSEWESLAQGRKIARSCALYKTYSGERSWKAIRDRLQAPSYLSRVDHKWKIRARKQRTRRQILLCEQDHYWLEPANRGGIGALSGKPYNFRKRVRKVVTSEAKWRRSEVKGNEVLIRNFKYR